MPDPDLMLPSRVGGLSPIAKRLDSTQVEGKSKNAAAEADVTRMSC
jgi:hypothetical protein